jgi:protein translocase SecG subunit
MLKIINFAQIVISVFLIAVILMQNKGAGMSAVFGGGDGNVFHTKRGAEKWLFYATIILVVLFIGLGIASLIIQKTP